MEVSGEAGLCGRKGKAQQRQFRNFVVANMHFDSLEAVLQFDLDIGAQLDIIKAELGVFTKVQICLSQLPENLVSLSR